jgi:glyoxylase-like metal-dependent hydrolase (beta-lactamase superfamily II)
VTAGAPAPVTGFGSGPDPVPGRLDRLGPALARLTAPNPGMMTGPGTNTYLVGRGDLVVVDPGPDDPVHRRAVVDAATELGGTIGAIAVTHAHPDHAPGTAPLAAATGARVFAAGVPGVLEPDTAVADGTVLEAGAARLRAVHTPGHASDHVCWLEERTGVLFAGDHLMEGVTVVIRPLDGDLGAYRASLERLRHLDPAVAVVAPGHGRLVDDPMGLVAAVEHHRTGRGRLVAGALDSAGVATVDDLVPAVYADVAPDRFAVARFSLWAHLRDLAAAGRATCGARGEAQLDAVWGATPTTRG